MGLGSKDYRDTEIEKNWECRGGPQKMQRFAEIVIKNIYFSPETPTSILDVGCATGEMVEILATYFPFAKVYGCDFSERAIERCQEKFPYLKSNFFVADTSELSKKTKRKFDLVVCSNVLEYVESPERALEELVKASKRYVLILTPAKQEALEKRSFHLEESFFTEKGFSVHRDFTTDVSTDGIQIVAILDKKSPLEHPPETYRVLVASPVRQDPEVLKEFLTSLSSLDISGLNVDFLFVDNNDSHISSSILSSFREKHPSTTIWRVPVMNPYERNENSHIWGESSIWRVAELKNRIISHALNKGYNYLFLVDSDLVLHPRTLKRLVETRKDIVSNIFWTKWNPRSSPLPQVWFTDHYTLYKRMRGENNLSPQEIQKRIKETISSLILYPGTYEVGGLGACTLLSRKALKKGVRFTPIHNVNFIGEDRHFCIRSVSLGLRLFVDTYYPAFHIYRKNDLIKVPYFKELCEENIKSGGPMNSIKLLQLVENPIADFLFQEGTRLTQQNQAEKALERFEEALRFNRSHVPTHNALAFIHWQRGNLEKALHHAAKAMEVDPNDRDTVWNYGQIMICLGKPEEARRTYAEYLKKHPEEKEMMEVVEKLENQ